MARLVQVILALALGLMAVSAFALLVAVETVPRVNGSQVADADAAQQARAFYHDLHRVAAGDAKTERWEVSEATLDGALSAAGRIIPGLAAQADVGERSVTILASLPLIRDLLWLNVRSRIGESSSSLVLEELRVGRLALPPGLVVDAARFLGDLVLGDRLASKALAAVGEVRTEPPIVAVRLDLDGIDRERLGERLREIRGRLAGSGDRERIYVYLWHLREATAAATLPGEGSLVAYLRFAVEQAAALAGTKQAGSDVEELRAALYALALYCGDAQFGTLVGVSPPGGDMQGCRDVELAGRSDLRQHFVLSAALEAATSTSAAFGIGELKELLDSAPEGSGFSFDDMAADIAGARFAQTLLGLPRARWADFVARLEKDADVMPPVADLPSGMAEAAFRAQFGDLESPEYRKMLDEIDRRTAALPLHSATDE